MAGSLSARGGGVSSPLGSVDSSRGHRGVRVAATRGHWRVARLRAAGDRRVLSEAMEHFWHWPPGMKLWTCLLVIALAGACGGGGSGGDEAPGSDDPDAGPSGDRPDARGCVG